MNPAVEGRNHHDRARHGRKERKNERKERKQNAERRNLAAALARRGARPAGRARLSAFHCGSCQGESFIPEAQPRPCFLRLGGSAGSYGPPSGEDLCAPPRALPAPACPSPASTSRTGHNAGRLMPEPPECGGDDTSARGHRNPLRQPESPAGVLVRERDGLFYFVTRHVTRNSAGGSYSFDLTRVFFRSLFAARAPKL